MRRIAAAVIAVTFLAGVAGMTQAQTPAPVAKPAGKAVEQMDKAGEKAKDKTDKVTDKATDKAKTADKKVATRLTGATRRQAATRAHPPSARPCSDKGG